MLRIVVAAVMLLAVVAAGSTLVMKSAEAGCQTTPKGVVCK